MKKLTLLIAIMTCTLGLMAQQSKQDTIPHAFVLDISPNFLLAKGLRLNSGFGQGHWQYGMTVYSHEVYEEVQEIVFSNSDGLEVIRNSAIQAYANWYPRASRKGFYLGGALSPEWYGVRTLDGQHQRQVWATYAVLKSGLRFFFFKDRIYLDFHVHLKYAMTSNKTQTFESGSYQVARLTGIPFWSIGVNVPQLKSRKR